MDGRINRWMDGERKRGRRGKRRREEMSWREERGNLTERVQREEKREMGAEAAEGMTDYER